MPPRTDTDTITNIDGHTVCWRHYGDTSPNKGQVSVILQVKGSWINIGVWPRGPVPMDEIRSRIVEATKK